MTTPVTFDRPIVVFEAFEGTIRDMALAVCDTVVTGRENIFLTRAYVALTHPDRSIGVVTFRMSEAQALIGVYTNLVESEMAAIPRNDFGVDARIDAERWQTIAGWATILHDLNAAIDAAEMQ